jgi:hypothetical protein
VVIVPQEITSHADFLRLVLSPGSSCRVIEKILDDAALAAYRQWRFEPGTVAKIKVPITFFIEMPTQSSLHTADLCAAHLKF